MMISQVYHSAWIELCTGMASARSLDEVIEVHEAYLLSIQRQCFVAPDKLVKFLFVAFPTLASVICRLCIDKKTEIAVLLI